MATKDFIGYQALLNQALLGVVRAALTHAAKGAAKGGVMGAHHFYITFDTQAPGVQLSQVMRERFPEQITIVLQNHYWDLKVNADDFEVGLSFNKVAETVVVPFAAIREFRDPSQNFGFRLQIEGQPGAQPRPTPKPEPAGTPEASPAPSTSAEPEDGKPTVVSLDKFRKK